MTCRRIVLEQLSILKNPLHEPTGNEFVLLLEYLEQACLLPEDFGMTQEDFAEIHQRFVASLDDKAMRRHCQMLALTNSERPKDPLLCLLWMCKPDLGFLLTKPA